MSHSLSQEASLEQEVPACVLPGEQYGSLISLIIAEQLPELKQRLHSRCAGRPG